MASEAIREFWSWWPSVATSIDEGIRAGGIADEVIDALSQRVASIDPDLDWELGPGHKARHHLCLSAKGDPKLRVVAERWRFKAPETSEVWEFHSARQAHPSAALVLRIAEQDVDFDQFRYRFELDERREVLDLEVYHPVFAQIEDEDLRVRIAFICLDNSLGEDGVERWIGGVEVLTEVPEQAFSPAQFAARVEKLGRDASGEQWAVLRGEIDGAPVIVTANFAIKRVDHLLLALHVEIDILLNAPTDEGLTTQAEADTLNEMEDRLFEALREHAVNIGRETHRGHRTLHLHVMDEGPAAGIIDTWKRNHPAHDIAIEVRPDPEWDVLQRWL
jgi:hypothetical protein